MLVERIKRRLVLFSAAQFWILLLVLAVFTVTFLFPLGTLFAKAFTGASGKFAGLANYRRYFSTPSLSNAVGNTVYVSIVTTCFSTLLGFLYAYGITRTLMPGKTFFRYIALLPIFIPTVVHALGLVYIFRQAGPYYPPWS